MSQAACLPQQAGRFGDTAGEECAPAWCVASFLAKTRIEAQSLTFCSRLGSLGWPSFVDILYLCYFSCQLDPKSKLNRWR